MSQAADICLFLEGTYPYISGGVSTWAHQLIKEQKHLTFYLVSILPPVGSLTPKYEIPSNVIGRTDVRLQSLPLGQLRVPKNVKSTFFKQLEMPILMLQHKPEIKNFEKILDLFNQFPYRLGRRTLIDSYESWNMLLRMYLSTMGESSFINFFWSWRSLLSSLYSVLLTELPNAKIYHSLCTGYGGLFLARAKLEKKRPCLITEHGIYTNERKIEISSANWLEDQRSINLSLDRPSYERDLKDFWIDTFYGYSKLCYDSCDEIITLYEGNKEFQIADGADPSLIKIIPNGVDFEEFSSIPRIAHDRPTIAFIGRVVPIKDVKTFINAISILKKSVLNVAAYIIGPVDEDPEYYRECVDLVVNMELDKNISFTGKVDVRKILGEIDILVLSSISESQPLVILEAGALGIPSIATDVGSCSELIFGRSDEDPPLGAGGAITPLSHPKAIADHLTAMLTDTDYYNALSRAIQKRVGTYYRKHDQIERYRTLYEHYLKESSWQELALS